MIKKNVIRIAALAILIIIGMQAMLPGLVLAERRPDPPQEPRVPDTAEIVDMTEEASVCCRYNLSYGTPSVIRFRNATMQFNASRQMELNITADPRLNMRYLDVDMHIDSPLRLMVRAEVDPPRDTPRPEDGLGRYINFMANSTAGVRAMLRLHISHAELNEELGRYVEVNRLRWCFWNGTDWQPATSWIDREGFLVCEMNRFANWTIREMRDPPTIPTPHIAGLATKARTYNYTMVTPKKFTWTVRERDGTAFAFRNMTMMFNCSRPLELNITAAEEVRQKLFRFELAPEDPLSLRMRLQVEAPEGVEAPHRWIGTYIEIEPNSTAPVNARLGMLVDDPALLQIMGGEMNASRLRWAYWNGTGWEVVDSYLDEDNVLVAETDHFSTWTVVETAASEPQEPEPEPPETGNDLMKWLPFLGVAAAGVVVILLLFRKRG